MLTYAHRGFGFNENSIQSFVNAFKYFDGIEFDVRLTRDNIPVVIHDYNLLRTRILAPVEESKFLQIQKLEDLLREQHLASALVGG